MKLIIGGAFQGKADYARKEYPECSWIDCSEMDLTQVHCAEDLIKVFSCDKGDIGILNFHEVIRYFVEQNIDYSTIAEMMIGHFSDAILTIQEVGYGVVPIDRIDREYREVVGRIATKLAAHSEKVIRVLCGIGTIIKR